MLIRVKNASTFQYLKEYLEPAGDYTDRDEMAQSLMEVLHRDSDNCFFLLDVLNDKVRGFLLAGIIGPNKQGIVIQSFGSSEITDPLFMRFLWWCEQQEIIEICADDMHLSKGEVEKWGFKKYKVIYVLNVQDSMTEQLSIRVKETSNVELQPGTATVSNNLNSDSTATGTDGQPDEPGEGGSTGN